MAENVEYVLSLKDLFSGKINEANKSAQVLEMTMKGIAGLAVAGFGLVGGMAFLKSSAEAFNEADKAGAQLNATLASTGNIANRTREQLDKQAESLMKHSTFDDDAITGAQSILLTFTNIRNEIVDKSMPAIVDYATKMGGDLKGSALQVGKALQDPTHGMLALRKAGVSFSQDQQDVIKNLQATGRLAEAQQIILNELNKEFGGSAQADANTYSGQMTILKHEFMNVKEEIGGVVMKLVVGLKPALEKGIELFSNTVHWVKENKDLFEALGFGIGVATTALIAYNGYQVALSIRSAINTGLIFAEMVATDGLAVALYAAGITGAVAWGLMTGGLTIVAAGLYYAWQKSETFRGGVLGVWGVMKGSFQFITQTGTGIGLIMDGIFSLDADKIKGGAMLVKDAYKNLDISGSFAKGFVNGAISGVGQGGLDTDFGNNGNKTNTILEDPTKPTKTTKTVGAGKSASSVTGQKVYTINIKIDNLVKDFKVSTTNITEGAGKVKELVAQALLSAVNDSQIIAER